MIFLYFRIFFVENGELGYGLVILKVRKFCL